jgi:hypothetical protein
VARRRLLTNITKVLHKWNDTGSNKAQTYSEKAISEMEVKWLFVTLDTCSYQTQIQIHATEVK